MKKDEYEQLEDLRKEMSDAVDNTNPNSLFGRILRWALSLLEKEQKDLIDEKFRRKRD